MILVAPDKFKGTFSAGEICRTVEERLKQSGVKKDIVSRPLSDGGEGVADVFMPGSKKISPGIYVTEDRVLAVSSEIIGFEAFAGSDIPLMQRSSIRLGEVVASVWDEIQPSEITVAVGGTATSDGGAGFLQGLGAMFYDGEGRMIVTPLTPESLTRVETADLELLKRYRLSAIIDVKATLCGNSELSALDFAEQKAIPGELLDGLEQALTHFQKIVGGSSPWDGAGGGVGYALASVCRAKCVSGGMAAIEALDVDWSQVEMVITGEGKVDSQTTRGGKLVDAICRKAASHGIPALVLYGAIEDDVSYPFMAQIETEWEPKVKTELLKASGSQI